MPGGKQCIVTTEQTSGDKDLVGDGGLQKLRIGNLRGGATEQQIRAMFLPHGPVQFYDRPLNEHTHRPGTTAYVEMVPAEAASAIKALKGTRLDGEVITVELSEPLGAWAPDAWRGPGSPRPRRIVTPQVGRGERP